MASEAVLLTKRCSACETNLLSNAKFCVECGLSTASADGGATHRSSKQQEKSRKKAKLSEERIVTSFVDVAWDESYRRLEAYRAEQGDCLVPHRYVTPDGDKLGIWVSNQRRAFKLKGKKGGLSEERMARLEALGFVWDRDDAAWDESYRRLEAYRAEQGDCLVPYRYVTPDGDKLGCWVGNQRQARKGMGGELSEERATRLEALGFVWAVRAYLPFSNSLPLEAIQPRRASAVGEVGTVGSLRPEADGLNPQMKHLYLSDADFELHFKMDKAAFEQLPAWKKNAKKKELRLF